MNEYTGKEVNPEQPYYPTEDLVNAVKYACILKRPLLIRGEPGCGKTRLAEAIAYELYGGDFKKYYFEWHIKSTTKAKDGLYTYDHLARLRDIQERNLDTNSDLDTSKGKYVKDQPIGKAYKSSKKGTPSILLIDEIDKADIDFPNDLLLELDENRFTIDETGDKIKAEEPPIIIITSNDEKELPNAFLRRCVFHYIEFPKKPILEKIVSAKVKNLFKGFLGQNLSTENSIDEKLQNEIIETFIGLHNKAKSNSNIDKVPSTSELLDWLTIIQSRKLKEPEFIKNNKLSETELKAVESMFKSLDDQKFAKEVYPKIREDIKNKIAQANKSE